MLFQNKLAIGITLCLLNSFLSAIGQALLKKSAIKKYSNIIFEYLNIYVLCGYGIYIITTFLSILIYQRISLSLGVVLDTSGYFQVTLFSTVLFHEKLTRKKIVSLCIIILGIIVYAI